MKHLVFEYNELCPECGKEASGFCNENLTGICEHCGAEILICSLCPVVCSCKENHEYCDICHYKHLNCMNIDCSNCLAKMKKTIKEENDGFVVLIDENAYSKLRNWSEKNPLFVKIDWINNLSLCEKLHIAKYGENDLDFMQNTITRKNRHILVKKECKYQDKCKNELGIDDEILDEHFNHYAQPDIDYRKIIQKCRQSLLKNNKIITKTVIKTVIKKGK